MIKGDNLLEHLFGSKAKMLRLFFQHPKLVLTIDDICKKIGIKNKLGRQVVADFIKLGIFKKAKINDQAQKNKIKKS